MKHLALIGILSLTMALTACGSDNSTHAAQSPLSPTEAAWKRVGPEVPVPHGPPPKKLVVRVLKKGSGAVVAKGDVAAVRYINVDYKTARVYEDNWDPPEPTYFNVGYGEVLGAWEAGMKGMRVGGRRELIVPAKLSYGRVPQIYVIELQSLKS